MKNKDFEGNSASEKNELEKFIEDEKYYLELNSSRFPFLENCIDDYDFLKDTKDYINECIKYYEYKLIPYIIAENPEIKM